MSERVPPHNIDAEVAVIGGIMLRNNAVGDVVTMGLEAEDFYHPTHRAIFDVMVELDEKNEPIDIITVPEALKRGDRWRGITGVEALLADCSSRVPTAENCRFFARIVRDCSSLRKAIQESARISGSAFANPPDTTQFLDASAAAMCALSDRSERQTYVSIGKLAVAAAETIQRRHDHNSTVTGVPTGYSDLDEITAGLQPGEEVILAARPGMGKSAMMLNIARNACVPALIFSLEMSKEALVERLIIAEGKIDGQRAKTGRLTNDEWLRLTQAVATVAVLPICIDDSGQQTTMSIRAKARRWRNDRNVFPLSSDDGKKSLGVVMLDYLQMVELRIEKGENAAHAVGQLTRAFKILAKDLGVPFLVLSQLNREIERREDRRPRLSDLRESGNIEQDADVVIFLYRDEPKKGDDDSNADDKTTEAIVAKQRSGPTGVANLTFLKEYSRFESQSLRSNEDYEASRRPYRDVVPLVELVESRPPKQPRQEELPLAQPVTPDQQYDNRRVLDESKFSEDASWTPEEDGEV